MRRVRGICEAVRAAIERETEIKGWAREKKVQSIGAQANDQRNLLNQSPALAGQIPRVLRSAKGSLGMTAYPRFPNRSIAPVKSGLMVTTSRIGSRFSFFIRATAFSMV